MLNNIVNTAFPFVFALFAACALTSLASVLAMMLYGMRRTNEAMRHPYLKQAPWARMTASVKATILLDYFLRLSCPNAKFWLAGQANQLLAHVDPAEVSNRVRWPLLGLWGGCLVGLVAMVTLWLLLFLKM